MEKGMVSLVGAGCGDPDFLTVKAQKRLKSCETLVYDSLVSEQIVEQVSADCEKIYVGKRYGRHAMKQEEINALLIQKAREGKRVVRLKGGDPYVFGRGGEEFLALSAEGIACEEIPGITSSIAVPAAAGIPVTHRGMSRSFTVITGTTADADGQEGMQMDFRTLSRLEGTLVILMGVHHLEAIADGLMAAGKDPRTSCAVIMEGTLAGQKCVRAPLADIAAQSAREGIRPPAVIVIGAVAQLELSPACDWSAEGGDTENRNEECCDADETQGASRAHRAAGQQKTALPLSGVTVGVTGTAHFAKKLSQALRNAGADVWDMSFMEIRESSGSLPDFAGYGWLVFTSPNGVRIFLDKMKREKRDLRSIYANKLAAIGPGTAQALEEAGMYADYVPEVYNAEHLAGGLVRRIREEAGQRTDTGSGQAKPALFLRAAKGSEALPRIFAENGIAYTEFPLYEIGVDEKKREQVMRQVPDYVVFGSGSGVRAYFGEKERCRGEAVCAEKTADRAVLCGNPSDESAPDSAGWEEGAPDRSASHGNVRAEGRIRYVCMGEACAGELARFTKEKFLVAQESSVAGIVACICRDLQTG